MAANLALRADGTAMMASLREMPWHKQGIVFDKELTGDEMLKAAGLDWELKTAKVSFNGTKRGVYGAIGWDKELDGPIMGHKEEAFGGTVEGMKVVYREDTGVAFGVVGSDYEVYQNKEIVSFFDGLVGDHKIVYETAGGLGKG